MIKTFIASKSQKMKSVYAMADKVAPTALNVLIQGEPGCGKNRLAEYIHATSGRQGNFCRLNPISLNGVEENLEKIILDFFLEAKSGTLLIDDVSYCSLKIQDYILKVWRDREEENNEGNVLNVRVIGATTRNLQELASQRRFRRSLSDRFVVPIILPPLRERRDDIPILIDIFDGGKSKLSKETMDMLYAYNWPGNVRELENVLKHASFHSGHEEITPSHLPSKIRRKNAAAAKATITDELYKLGQGLIESGVHSESLIPYDEYLKIIEAPLIKAALDYGGGNKSAAAKLLKINRNTVSKKIKDYGIE